MTNSSPDSTWPIFGVRITTPRLELRPIDDEVGRELVLLANRGVHRPGEMPFNVPWTRTPLPRREWETRQYYWRCWAEWSPTHWHLPFGTFVGGRLVGMTELLSDNFPILRTVGTGSWIGLAEHGRGYGTEQRAAMLAFAFQHLGAQRAETSAWDDNHASIRVGEKLGYRLNGDAVKLVDGVARRGVDFVLDRADWEAERARNPLHVDIEVTGLADALPQFGLEADAGRAS